MFDEIYNQKVNNNKYILEESGNTTATYIKEIEKFKDYKKDSRLVNCLTKNKFNLRQIGCEVPYIDNIHDQVTFLWWCGGQGRKLMQEN